MSAELDRWLDRVGLAQYSQLFKDRKISLDAIMGFTDLDLQQLGLTPSASLTVLRERAHLATRTAVADTHRQAAERRQLTVMFCDVVDSVRLSSRLDPEDLREVIGVYQSACAQSIQRYDGYVARYVGDGILAFFGYPVAHEDDAERSVRAARELVKAVTNLDHQRLAKDIKLKVRVGIATGLVVVGDVVAQGVFEKDAVAGEAANLASRLQGLARPNTVIVSSLTRELAGGAFDYRDLGTQSLKGFDHPVPAYEVIAEKDVSRLEARGVARAPFIGREKEIEVALRCWERATSGKGQVVVLSGEAGIGKSRLLAETRSRIHRIEQPTGVETLSPLTFQCAPYHVNTAFYPIVKQLVRLSGIEQAESNQEKVDKLETFLRASDVKHDRALALFVDLLGLEPVARCPPLNVGSAEKRYLTVDALIAWCSSYLSNRTLMLAFEDVQWIDPTSKLLLERLITWVEGARALILITVRAPFGASVSEYIAGNRANLTHITTCEIGELSEQEAKQLMIATSEEITMSAPEMQYVLQRSAGSPLFVEELTKGVLNAKDSPDGRSTNQAPSLTVPHSISDALMARLDQLGRAKEIAQCASVIGEEFSSSLVARVMARSHEEVIQRLDLLVSSNIVVSTAVTSDIYYFKHALIRDVSYGSMLNKSRRDIHRRVASELRRQSTQSVGAPDELIARHYSLGEAYGESVDLWLSGAKKAIFRSAHEEALGMLGSAFDDFGKLPDPGSSALELDLVLAQATALRSIRGYSAPDVEERLARARKLCSICGDAEKRFSVEWGLFQCNIVKADIASARALASNLISYAELDPRRPFVDAYLAMGIVAFARGKFDDARSSFERGLALSELESDEPHFFTHGQNPGLFCLSYLAHTLCFLGQLDKARSLVERSLSIAQRRANDPAHIYGYVNALTFAVRVYQFCGDMELERCWANALMEVSRRNHYRYYEALSRCHLAWAVGNEGAPSVGIDKMMEGIAALEETGTWLALPGFYVLLSKLCIRADRLCDAETALTKAVGRSEFATWHAEIERVRGDIFALQDPPNLAAAELAYRSSLDIALRQNASPQMLKAALSLAELLRMMKRDRDAQEILKLCLGRLPDGSEMDDANRAWAMLGKLGDPNCVAPSVLN
jgi:class 3 adenylate cyclase/tetratricopeptide (TPR) repeat protein